jgi:hypothetical protein
LLRQLQNREIAQVKQEVDQWTLKHTEANQQKKGIFLQLQNELKNKVSLVKNNNYFND